MVGRLLRGVGFLLLALPLIQIFSRSCCLGSLLPFPFPFAPPLLLHHPLPRVPMGLGPPPLHMPNIQDKAEVFMIGDEGKARDQHHHHHHHHHHQHGHHHAHGHKHQHGHQHDHKHGHEHQHGHQHDHKHGHKHQHGHDHKHNHGHQHDHKHGHDHQHNHGHDHKHENEHKHQHGHDHNHNHQHGHDHGHDHKHNHQHGHDHQHNHGHGHDHKHNHEHGHDHGHNHNHGHNHGHGHQLGHGSYQSQHINYHNQDNELNNDHKHDHQQQTSPYPPHEGYITNAHDPELDQNDHNQKHGQDLPEGAYDEDVRSQETFIGNPHNPQPHMDQELGRRPLFFQKPMSNTEIRSNLHSYLDHRFYRITIPKMVKSSFEHSGKSPKDSSIQHKQTHRTKNGEQNDAQHASKTDQPKSKDEPRLGGQRNEDTVQNKPHDRVRNKFPSKEASISSVAFLHDNGDIVTVGNTDPYLSIEQPLKLEDDGLYKGKTIESRLNNYFRNFNLTPASDHKLSVGDIGEIWNIPLFD